MKKVPKILPLCPELHLGLQSEVRGVSNLGAVLGLLPGESVYLEHFTDNLGKGTQEVEAGLAAALASKIAG